MKLRRVFLFPVYIFLFSKQNRLLLDLTIKICGVKYYCEIDLIFAGELFQYFRTDNINRSRMGGGLSVLAQQEGLTDCPVQGATGGLALLAHSGG